MTTCIYPASFIEKVSSIYFLSAIDFSGLSTWLALITGFYIKKYMIYNIIWKVYDADPLF